MENKLSGDIMQSETEIINQVEHSDMIVEKKVNAKMSVLARVTILLSILVVGSFGFTYYVYSSGKSELNKTKAELDLTRSNFAATYLKLDNLEKKNDSDLARLDSLENSMNLTSFQHDVEEGVVTENLVVNKLTVRSDGTIVRGVVDFTTQPTIALKYTGLGKFDVPDRELKGMVTDLIKKIQESYASYFDESKFPKWSDGEYSLTIQNYEIGNYSKGVFKLKGE
jgi:hypothetical protein